MDDDDDEDSGNDTSAESSSSSPSSPEPFEVTLSSLLVKNLAEHLNETGNDALERITQAMASNISSSLRDTWNLTAKNNVPAMDDFDPFLFNVSGIVLLAKRKSDREIW